MKLFTPQLFRSSADVRSTGAVKNTSNPSGRALTWCASNGVFPVHTSRCSPHCARPVAPQPRLVCPTYIEPSFPQTWRNTPDMNPSRKGNTTPWYTPSTFSSATRMILLCPWSPTNSWPANGPNEPRVESTRIADVEIPRMPCGNHTAGVLRCGTRLATSNFGSPVSGMSLTLSVTPELGSPDHLSPFTLPMKSPFSTWLIPPEPTQSPLFSA